MDAVALSIFVNISWVVRYRDQVEEQKVEEVKLIKGNEK